MILRNGNRVIPVRLVNEEFRACTLRQYCAAGSVGMYYYSGGSYDTYYSNADTALYHQPSLYGEGNPHLQTTTDIKRIAVMISVHFSPDTASLPTLGVGAGGTVAGATNCRYTDGFLDFQRVDAEHALHNVANLGPDVSLGTSYGFDADLTGTAYSGKQVRIKGSTWFFLRATSTGNIVPTFGNVRYKIYSLAAGGTYGDAVSLQDTTVISAAKDEWLYYMVKAGNRGTILWPTNPYSSSYPDVHFFPQTIYQPTLGVTFTGTTGSCTVQAMGWGYDVWAYDWVD